MTNQLNQIMQMFGGQQNFLSQFNNLKNQFSMQGVDPRQRVQDMLNSGQMSQEQFNRLRAMANLISGRNM